MKWRPPHLLTFWWVFLAAAAVWMRLRSTGILESGDGIQHYQIARYSWQHHELFLHSWGKPLFTLLSSPFAQLGIRGMTLFNALCLVATAWAADGILKRAGQAARWLYAPILLLVPMYGTMVLAGMTEVLFGLLTVLVIRALFEERYVLAMVLLSLTPFARPEYIGLAPFVLAWVVGKRQWRALPWGLTGHALYALAATVLVGDPLLALHDGTYGGAAAIYGQGPLLHFASHLPEIFGMPLLLVGIPALFAGAWLWWKKPEDRSTLRLLLIVGLLPALAIAAIHSFLWWKGLKGSLGLLRVLATTAPLVVLCVVWPIVRTLSLPRVWWIERFVFTTGVGVLFLHAAWKALLLVQPLPVVPNDYEVFVQRVGAEVGRVKGDYDRVLYYHPAVAFYADIDPFDHSTAQQLFGLDTMRTDLGLGPEDLLVWDAHFGPNEGHTPLRLLRDRPNFRLEEVMVPQDRMEVLGGLPFEAWFFQRGMDQRHEMRTVLFDASTPVPAELEHHVDTIPCVEGGKTWCFKAEEFPLEVKQLPLQAPGLIYAEVVVSGTFKRANGNGDDIKMIVSAYDTQEKAGYWWQPLWDGPFTFTYRVPAAIAGLKYKLYIWDINRNGCSISDLRVEINRVVR